MKRLPISRTTNNGHEQRESIWSKLSFKLLYKPEISFGNFITKPLLIIGCGHDNSLAEGNCKSAHEGAVTIDINAKIKPDFIIDMGNLDLIRDNLGCKFNKIVFEGYSPSFWDIHVIQYLFNHLTEHGTIYLAGHPQTARILTAVDQVAPETYDFVHKYAKIFSYKTLNERLVELKRYSSFDHPAINYKPDSLDDEKIETIVEDAINTRDFKKFIYLIEAKNLAITRTNAYTIAKIGDPKFIRYIIENTPIIAMFCSPYDETENFRNFLEKIPFSKNDQTYAEKILSISALSELCFVDCIFDARSLLTKDLDHFEEKICDLFIELTGEQSDEQPPDTIML